ncbi:hypothetical protein VN0138_12080 [Helicobacter pylori]
MQTIYIGYIGVLSASDRASKGIYEDLSGKAIQDLLKILSITLLFGNTI